MAQDRFDSGGSVGGPLPRGIEILLCKASVDEAFRERLLDMRTAAATEIGLDLEPAEAAMLGAIPAEQLSAAVDNVRVPAPSRAAFLGKVAALMLAALGSGACRPYFPEFENIRKIKGHTAKTQCALQLLEKERSAVEELERHESTLEDRGELREARKERKLHEARVKFLERSMEREKRHREEAFRRAREQHEKGK